MLRLNELHSSHNIRIEWQKYLFVNSLHRAERVEAHLHWVQQPILGLWMSGNSVWNTKHHKFILFFHRNTFTHTRTRNQKSNDEMGCEVSAGDESNV